MIVFIIEVYLSAAVLIFLKAVQQQNVIGGHYLLVVPISFGIALAEIGIVIWVANDYGWSAWFSLGAGGASGALLGMFVHRYFVGGVNVIARKA